MNVDRRSREDAVELRRRHARETAEALQRLGASPRDPHEVANLHELHARHERELGHDENAARAEERARNARNRAEQQ